MFFIAGALGVELISTQICDKIPLKYITRVIDNLGGETYARNVRHTNRAISSLFC